ncbi:SpvB/TcaC N-terminal domain-containing protein [Parafilimonas sp.]|uniref:SpvB/TcaC N-terminal domain-containing protein n=1 Tax=Parafilimonas sp. TaxID=1969739 RepID=UPI003F7DEF10
MKNYTLIVKLTFLLISTCLPAISFLQAQTIDLSKPVGSTGGLGASNGAGGLTYTIPIETTSGINGLQPNISLVYNSQGGDGNFGWGWSLSAISTITRAGKSNYYNGINAPVSFTNTNDAFVLDGQRLFVTSGTNGANGTVYGTENEQYNKIESFGGTETSGPTWFKVTLKNGTVMEYGNATNTKLLNDAQTGNLVWLLNRITDINGNYEDFKYSVSNTDRNFALTEIDYTGNTTQGIAPLDKVQFTYTVKPNWQTQKSFVSGASFTTPFLLSTIKVIHEDDIVVTTKTYSCSYTSLHGQYFLQTFTENERGSGIENLNPLRFTYGSNTAAADVDVSPSYGQFNYNNTYTGEITGDGKQDLVAAYLYYDNNGWPHYTQYAVFDEFSSYVGQPAMSIAYTYNFPTGSTQASQIKGSTNYYNFLTFDYDGDSKQDVLMANWNLSGTEMIYTGITINYSRFYTATQGQTYKTVQYPSIPHVSSYTQDFKYSYKNGTNFIPGDFDGDGVQDYILILGINSTNSFKAFFSSPKKGIVNQEITGFGVEGTSTDPFYANSVANATDVTPIDFNGDGKTEILVQKSSQSYILSVYPVSITTGYNWAATKLYTTAAIKTGYRVLPGDFNGDGNTDLLVRSSETDPNGAWNILYSTGTVYTSFPFIFQKKPYLEGDNGATNAHLLMIADLNGDGKTDVWHSLDDASGGLHSLHTIYYSNGIPMPGQNSTTAFAPYTYSRTESINKSTNTQTIYGDINGDGKEDLLTLNGTVSRFIYPKPFKEDRLLVNSIDGLGNQTNYNYALLTSSSVYQRSTSYDYDNPNQSPGQQTNGNPYMVIKAPLYALSGIVMPNGIGGTTTLSYSYQDAAVSPVRGFLGYKQLTETNYATNFVQTRISEIDANLLIPYVTEQKTTYGTTTISDTKLTNVLTRVYPGNSFDKRYTYRVTETNETNGLTGAATQSTNTFDTYNNITTNVTGKGYMNSSTFTATETTTTTTVFGTHNTPVPAAPESVTVSSTRSGQTAVSKKTTYTYDTKGNVITVTDFAGTALATTTTNTYNGFGNITKIVISAPSTTTPVTNLSYDYSGRYLLQKQMVGSGITKTEKYTYDPYFGLLASATASDGLVTNYTYDGFGRRNKTTFPDGNAITETIGWETTGARYSVVSQRVADGGMYKKVYYDVLGRTVKTETGGFNGQNLTSSIVYDYKGRVFSQTDPHYTSETTVTNLFTYDDYGRQIKVANGMTSISTAYAKLSGGKFKVTTTNGASQSSSKTQDGAGRIVNAIDNGGQLNFTYDSWGNQTKVGLGGKALVTSVYDDYGRQTSLKDINASTIAYEYDALGKITKQTDAKGNVTNMVYDAFGRVTTRAGAEGTTSYEYYKDAASGKCNDNFSKITGFAGDVTSYAYDNLSRPTSESVVFDGTTFTKTMGYDAYSNLNKTTYPSGVIINDTYDKNGILTKTTMGSGTPTTLFTATAMNSKGIYTGYTYGNGKASTVTYDLAKGTPTRYYTAGIQDLNMNFNGGTGNLDWRKDAIKGLTENFLYDNLNRLTSAKVGTSAAYTIIYDNTNGTSYGNIQSKSDIGNYTYKTGKINAVAYITSTAGGTTPPGVISQNLQQITYTPFLKAATLTENDYNLTYTYGQNQQRIKSVLKQSGAVIETKYYLGAFERQTKGGVTRDIHYINAGNGLCAIIVKEGSTITPYYVYSDHLGSILTLTNATGAVVVEQNFDAWGRRRSAANWTYSGLPVLPDWLYRGYTGHEHVVQFALINMNGRMYDYLTGRMISPDNYVPLPWNTQGYNRYGYANNNPLVYTDPDGNFFFLAPIIIGAVVGGVFGTIQSLEQGKSPFWGFVKGAAVGAVGGYIGGSLLYGSFASLGMVGSGIANGAITGAVTGGLNSALNGSNILNGIGTGALIGGITGGIQGAIKRLSLKPVDSQLPGDPSLTGETFDSQEQLDSYIDNHIGNTDQLESDFNTKVMLGNASDLPKGYTYDASNNMIYNSKGGLVGGYTSDYRGGWFSTLKSTIHISPGVAGYNSNGVNLAHMTIAHEFIHAYHINLGLGSNIYNTYSEKAASSYSLVYSKAYNLSPWLTNAYRSLVGDGQYPKAYSWLNLIGKLNFGLIPR